MHTMTMMICVLLIALVPLLLPGASADGLDCEYDYGYVGPRTLTFTCFAGWSDPLVHVVDASGTPCYDVYLLEPQKLRVELAAACLNDDTGMVGFATVGRIIISD